MSEGGKKSGRTSEFRGTPRLKRADSEQILEAAFGHPLPADESALWATMSTSQQGSAIKRLRVMVAIDDPEKTQLMGFPSGYFDKGPAMTQAALASDLSLNRWYEMRAAWRQNRSLASLGTFAATPRTRVLPYHNDLQELAIHVVDANPKDSVRQLALALGSAYGDKTGLPEDKWPSYNTLRKFVEAERRLRTRTDQAGIEVQFDCCACELPHSEATFVAFLVVDRNTRLLLGAALGDPDDSRKGYASAAVDALKRIAAPPLNGIQWADRLVQSELVMGRDVDVWAGQDGEMLNAGLSSPLKLATPLQRRFRLFGRQLIGGRLGRVKFVPGRTRDVLAAKPTQEDVERLQVEVNFYNEHSAPIFKSTDQKEAPAGLVDLLRKLAKS